jgi:hypothetical protein
MMLKKGYHISKIILTKIHINNITLYTLITYQICLENPKIMMKKQLK